MSNWMTKSLGELCFGRGEYGPALSGVRGVEDWPRYIRITDISDEGRLLNNDAKFLSPEDAKGYLLQKGDIIFARSGSVGRTYLHNGKFKAAFAGYMIRFRPDKSKVLPEYLNAYTHTAIYEKWVASMMRAGTQPNINAKEYASLPVILPSIKEQQKIAEILADCDAAIEQAVSRRDAFKKEILGFVDRAFSPKATRKWKPRVISDLGKIVSGGTPSRENQSFWDGDIAWATPTDITGLSGRFIGETEDNITQAGVSASSTTILPAGSLLVCTRATVGDCAINTVPMATNQGFKSIIPSESVDVDFLYYLILSIKKEIIRRSAGSTFLEISKSQFASIPVLVPNFPRQKLIGATLKCAQTRIEKQNEIINLIKQQKRGLMQQLLTGKLRVKEVA